LTLKLRLVSLLGALASILPGAKKVKHLSSHRMAGAASI